jgi:GNAT superfamily N-acetyltransferase
MISSEILTVTEIPRPAGYPALAEEAAQLLIHELGFHSPQDLAKEDILEQMQQGHTIAAINTEGAVVGAGVMMIHPKHPNVFEVEELALRPDYRHKGIGSVILQSLEDIARKNNIHTVRIYSQDSAIGFYEKHGYTEPDPGSNEFFKHIH